jgi:hypothetical protein
MTVQLKVHDTTVTVKAPYNYLFVEGARRFSGIYSRMYDVWTFSRAHADAVRDLLLHIFGEDGETPPVRVTIKATFLSDASAEKGPVYLGTLPIAEARGRDSGAKPCSNAAIIAGTPRSGGSVKNWKTVIPAGCIFQIPDVPLPLAERLAQDFTGKDYSSVKVEFDRPPEPTLQPEDAPAPEPEPEAPYSDLSPQNPPCEFNIAVDAETALQVEKLVYESGLSRQGWLLRAVHMAISLQLLDAQMTEGTVKGGFSRPGGPKPGESTPKPEQKRRKRAEKKPKPDQTPPKDAKSAPKADKSEPKADESAPKSRAKRGSASEDGGPRPLDAQETAAVAVYMAKHGLKKWRDDLRQVWENGNPQGEIETILYALRNSHGPEWLATYRLGARSAKK